MNGGELPPQKTMTDALAIVKNTLPDMILYINYQAKITRANYLALIAEGFTKKQAENICAKQPIIGGITNG
jgi:hypothetical protein